MKPVIDLTKEYGIVLEGGGARGAYQIGAWRALKEAGVKIKGISGTSVGALNGALICMGDLEKAERIWKNISYSRIMDVDDEVMKNLLRGKLPLKEFLQESRKMIREGGFDITPLKNLIDQEIRPEKIRESDMEFFLQVFHVDSLQELHINVKEVEPELIKDLLLASACMYPVFKKEKFFGETLIDGGIADNVPVGVLLEEGYKDILVVRIYGLGLTKPVIVPEDVQIGTIEPRIDLGSIMEFDRDRRQRNMVAGYYDAMRMIYGLSGIIYYIDQNQDQVYYLNSLVKLKEKEEELRRYVEAVLPKMARELRLGEWDYEKLYLSILEATAKLARVPKYRIYTAEELLEEIRKNKENLEEEDDLPDFARRLIGEEAPVK